MTAPLTPAEERVLRLRAKGLTNKEVAHILGVSEQTTKNQITAIYEKLEVDNLVSALRSRGWVRVPGQPVERGTCDFIAKCDRPLGHRGHHGGFRAVPPAGRDR